MTNGRRVVGDGRDISRTGHSTALIAGHGDKQSRPTKFRVANLTVARLKHFERRNHHLCKMVYKTFQAISYLYPFLSCCVYRFCNTSPDGGATT